MIDIICHILVSGCHYQAELSEQAHQLRRCAGGSTVGLDGGPLRVQDQRLKDAGQTWGLECERTEREVPTRRLRRRKNRYSSRLQTSNLSERYGSYQVNFTLKKHLRAMVHRIQSHLLDQIWLALQKCVILNWFYIAHRPKNRSWRTFPPRIKLTKSLNDILAVYFNPEG